MNALAIEYERRPPGVYVLLPPRRARPVVDLRGLPYRRIANSLDRILDAHEAGGALAFPWIFQDVPPAKA